MKKELAEKVNIIVKNSGKDAFPINNSNDGNSGKTAQAASFSAKDVLEELKASVSAADYAHNTGQYLSHICFIAEPVKNYIHECRKSYHSCKTHMGYDHKEHIYYNL